MHIIPNNQTRLEPKLQIWGSHKSKRDWFAVQRMEPISICKYHLVAQVSSSWNLLLEELGRWKLVFIHTLNK